MDLILKNQKIMLNFVILLLGARGFEWKNLEYFLRQWKLSRF